MSGYLIANYKITNPQAYKTYGAAVGPTILAHGGEILVAGPGSEIVEGSPEPVSVIVKFPSVQALREWYDSPEYQAIIHHRLDNTEGSMVFAGAFKSPA
jgi:uncharacterized protein (DUF1330 family)